MSSYTTVRYHTLDDPLNAKRLTAQYSDLHSLYPGRPMDSDDNHNRYHVEHENPEAAREMLADTRAKTGQYGQQLERNARRNSTMDGGKMTVNAVADPSELTENPELNQNNMVEPSPDLADGTPLSAGKERAPLENFDGKVVKNKYAGESTTSNKWWWIALLVAGMAILAYYISNRDKYAF